MHSLIEPDVMKAAGVAAVITTAACYPDLLLRLPPSAPIGLFMLVMLWGAFFLWDFVFAWHEQYSGRSILKIPLNPGLWGRVSLTALICAAIMSLLLDPLVRQWTPNDYPHSLKDWLAILWFSFSFGPLFLCFAPFAVFIRLFKNIRVAMALAVCFSLFVLYQKISSSPTMPPWSLAASLVIYQLLGSSLTVYFYLEGGLTLVWWWTFLLHCRLLFGLL